MKDESFFKCHVPLVMNNVAFCMHQNMVFHSEVIGKKMAGLWHCAHMASVHSLHGVQQWFGYLTLETQG